MMNRICNLKAGILFLENTKERIIESGKEVFQRVRDRRYRDFDETKGSKGVKEKSKEQTKRQREPELAL